MDNIHQAQDGFYSFNSNLNKRRNRFYYQILKNRPKFNSNESETKYFNLEYFGQFNVGDVQYNGNTKGIPSELVEICFKLKKKQIYKNPHKLLFSGFEYVIVEVENGFDMGTVLSIGEEANEKWLKNYKSEPIGFSVVRFAAEKDIELFEKNRSEEPLVVQAARELSKKHNLDIKVTEAEWQLDRQRLTIYFSAPQRVDFRELVKDLAKIYKTRIELRQISTREEARRLGGVGPCGLSLCCSTFGCKNCHVTLEHAKTQRLANNVSKLSGYCGRLKCCILYEHDVYVEEYKNYPPMFSIVDLPDGMAKINKIDIFSHRVHLVMEDTGFTRIVSKEFIEKLEKEGKIHPPDKIEDEQIYDDDHRLSHEDLSLLENDLF